MEMKTWEDLEKLSVGIPWSENNDPTLILGEPILNTFLMLARTGKMTRNQALIQVVVYLIEAKNQQHATIMDLLNRRPLHPFVIPADPGA